MAGPTVPSFTRRGFAGASLAALAAGCGQAVIGLDLDRRTLDIGNVGEPLSLDPHKVSGQVENNVIGNMFLGLTTEDDQARPIPGMAERWETSRDGLVWTFRLRPAQWSDGAPCTAADFEAGFRRILNPETIAEYASILYPIHNAEAAKTGAVPVDQVGVRALDAATLEIRLEHPAPYLPGLLKHYTAYPIPAHVVAKHGDAWIKPENVVVNGAYTAVKWWSNTLVHLRKNPRFYDAANVHFEEAFFYPTSNSEAAARRIMRGELAMNGDFAGLKEEYYRERLPGFVQIHPWMLVNYISLNMRKPPFDDPRVRRALSLAVNREFLCAQIWRSGYSPAYGFVPPGMAGYPQGARLAFAEMARPARLEEGRRLLAEAGYGPARPLRFTFQHRNTRENPSIAVVLQSDWRELGAFVQAQLQGQETQIHYARLRAHDFEAADGGWIADFNDARNYLYLMETRTGAQNYSGHSDPTFDALMQAADRERRADVRAELLREAEARALAVDPIIPLGVGASRHLIDPRLEGWTGNLEDIHRLRWIRPRPDSAREKPQTA